MNKICYIQFRKLSALLVTKNINEMYVPTTTPALQGPYLGKAHT